MTASTETKPACTPKPRNAAATRAAILAAAQEGFSRDAYEQVGLREIGARAGVDPALISRYFGSKEELFAEALASTAGDPDAILQGDRADFGLRVARVMLQPEDAGADRKMAFINMAVRSAASPVGQKLVGRHIEERFIRPFAAWLGGEDAEERARLAATLIIGVAVLKGALFAPRYGADGAEADIARLAAALQAVIDQPAA